jgi:hypothetical protein
MKNLSNRVSSIPTSFEQIDRLAYEHLQKVRRRTRNNFNIEAAEFAQDAALKILDRQATGVKLAEDLVRDGRRKAMQAHNPDSYLSKGVNEFLRQQDTYDLQVPEKADNFKLSLAIIKKALNTLSGKELLALYLKITTQDSAEQITALLNVSTRQYRYYMTGMRRQLHGYPGFKQAYMLIFLHAQEGDLIQYLLILIKKQLATQKAA